jgi:hypothetical protein
MVSVHGHLASLLLAYGWQNIMAECVLLGEICSPHGGWEAKGKREKDWDQGHALDDLTFFQWALYPKGSTMSQQLHPLASKSTTLGLCGNI